MPQMTFEAFVASARLTHYDKLTEDERSHAPNYEGHEVVVFEGGPALCKDDDVFWFEDYKETFSGPWDQMVRQFYDFLIGEDALQTIEA